MKARLPQGLLHLEVAGVGSGQQALQAGVLQLVPPAGVEGGGSVRSQEARRRRGLLQYRGRGGTCRQQGRDQQGHRQAHHGWTSLAQMDAARERPCQVEETGGRRDMANS
ncbi:MAG: hypothetical protein J0L58_13255 [Burkholderiales bacterium]|nr:hypothetical protein [Burkholderiales bacterium]